jgi:hypothetical protein
MKDDRDDVRENGANGDDRDRKRMYHYLYFTSFLHLLTAGSFG